MENKIIEKEEINISESIAQPSLDAIRPKSNKKKVIVLSSIIAAVVVIIGIVVSVIVIAGNSNSLWKKPVDEEYFCYRYNVTPEEFIDKANELYIDNVHHEFEYGDKAAIEDVNESAERYFYDISSFKLYDQSAYYSQCAVDYYEDKTIHQTSLMCPYREVFSFDWAYEDLCVSAVQILYAYNAFEADSAKDVLNAFKSYSDLLEKTAQNQRIQLYFKYDDFVLYLFENENSEALYWKIQKTDEQGVENLEKTLGASLINLADKVSSNDDNEGTKKETETKEVKKSPEDCFVRTREIYEKVKPFFAKYGYDIDNWNVTVDDGNIFSAETSSEAIVLQDSSLMINLAKDSNITRGLQVFATGNSANNIQLWFDGNDKDKAYELLNIIFDDAYVDDKTLSEYIESEYESYLNEGNVANWTNGEIKYTIQFNDDLTFISLYRN